MSEFREVAPNTKFYLDGKIHFKLPGIEMFKCQIRVNAVQLNLNAGEYRAVPVMIADDRQILFKPENGEVGQVEFFRNERGGDAECVKLNSPDSIYESEGSRRLRNVNAVKLGKPITFVNFSI